MKKCLAILLLVLCCFNTCYTQEFRKLALIWAIDYTGNKNKIPELKCAESDGDTLCKRFKELGYDVVYIKGKGATKNGLNKSLKEIHEKASGTDLFVFVFCGHGVVDNAPQLIDGEDDYRLDDYVIPYDGNMDDITTSCISFQSVRSQVSNINCTHKIIFYDACREYAKNINTAKKFIDPDKKIWTFFSASQGKKAFDGKVYSHFTEAFLKILDTPGAAINDVFLNLAESIPVIARKAGDAQTPVCHTVNLPSYQALPILNPERIDQLIPDTVIIKPPKEELSFIDYAGHEYVDLGLSVKWATCNIGASKPEECGDYFAWGETISKSFYSNRNMKYGKASIYYYDYMGLDSLFKYNNSAAGIKDGCTVLQPEDDAARVNWGGSWHSSARICRVSHRGYSSPSYRGNNLGFRLAL